MNTKLERNDAVKILMDMLIPIAYQRVIRGLEALLVDGPPGRKPAEENIALHKWYQQLDTQSQAHVQAIVQKAVGSTIFSFLTMLDRAAGGPPLEGVESDFALYLQAYENMDAEALDQPTIRVKLNAWSATEPLHDMFRWALEEQGVTLK